MDEQTGKSNEKLIAIVAIVGVLCLVAGYLLGQWAGTGERTQTQQSVEEPMKPVELSGTGPKATDKVALKEGLITATYSHSGESNFVIDILGTDGKSVELLVNEIGPKEGSKAFRIDKAGEYIMSVEADGAWKINLK